MFALATQPYASPRETGVLILGAGSADWS
jgi:hypothetical protein